ncbi:MAG: hypothetical protein AAF724_07695 [Pseudomonadota bacterium]
MALAGCILGFINYFGHELIWSRISWGRHPDAVTKSASQEGAQHAEQ